MPAKPTHPFTAATLAAVDASITAVLQLPVPVAYSVAPAITLDMQNLQRACKNWPATRDDLVQAIQNVLFYVLNYSRKEYDDLVAKMKKDAAQIPALAKGLHNEMTQVCKIVNDEATKVKQWRMTFSNEYGRLVHDRATLEAKIQVEKRKLTTLYQQKERAKHSSDPIDGLFTTFGGEVGHQTWQFEKKGMGIESAAVRIQELIDDESDQLGKLVALRGPLATLIQQTGTVEVGLLNIATSFDEVANAFGSAIDETAPLAESGTWFQQELDTIKKDLAEVYNAAAAVVVTGG